MPDMENDWPIDSRFPSGKLGLFFDKEVQRLIDSFAYCFKVKITIFSARMEEMIVGLQNPGSPYCQLIQKKLKFRYRCCGQDKMMCEQCERKNETIVYNCYAGLSEIVMPIKIEGNLVGYGLLGQFSTGRNLPEIIRENWVKAGLNLEELKKVYDAQPMFDKPALDNMLRLFTMMIAFIVTREYVRFRRPGLTERVIHWVDEHISEPLRLDAIAEELNYSTSAISHTLNRQLGMSFKKICILKKIQRFESIITVDPNLSVQEAAALVGFNDPLYFSRIYRKIRLSAPSIYMNSMRKQIPD